MCSPPPAAWPSGTRLLEGCPSRVIHPTGTVTQVYPCSYRGHPRARRALWRRAESPAACVVKGVNESEIYAYSSDPSQSS